MVEDDVIGARRGCGICACVRACVGELLIRVRTSLQRRSAWGLLAAEVGFDRLTTWGAMQDALLMGNAGGAREG